MAGVATGRVVEVRCPHPDGTSEVGSGTLVADRLVLTAAHVVHQHDGAPFPLVRIRLAEQDHWVEGRVVWPTDAGWGAGRWVRGFGADAALVKITDGTWSPPRLGALRWGRLTGQNPRAVCEALGYPRVLRDPDARRGREPLTGRVVSIGDLAAGRYDIHVDGAAPTGNPDTAAGGHPWGGMSGAGLIANGLLVGVIVIDQPGFAHDRLTAVPASTLASLPGFATWVTGAALPLRLDSVELTGVFATPTMRPARLSPAQLLVPDAAVVPFHGREQLLDELRDWCLGAEVAGVRLVTGPGGQGKTRLALRLADRMQDGHGWSAGLLRPDPRTGDPVDLTPLAATGIPILLVVDYAETRTTALHRLLTLAAETAYAGDIANLRILALARAAGDWWDQLHLDHPHLLSTPPLELAGLGDAADRAAGFRSAAAALADRMPEVDPTPGIDWTALAESLTPPDLTPARFGSPLTLHLTALNALLATGPHPVNTTPDQPPETELLTHETRYWRDTAHDRGLRYQPVTLGRAVAAATLLGATDETQAQATIRRVPGLTDLTDDQQLAVIGWLHDLYPHPDGQYWGGLQPDRLGEHHIGNFTATTPTLLSALLAGIGDAQIYQALTVLARAATHQSHLTDQLAAVLATDLPRLAPPALQVVTQTPDPWSVTTALTIAVTAADPDIDTLRTVSVQLPKVSFALAPLAADLATRIVAATRAAATQDPDTYLPDLAMALNNQANRLGALSRREHALAAINEAVTVYRDLAAGDPDTYLPDLAMSLNNQANRLSDLGRPEDALAAINEAVTVRRALAAARPNDHLPDLASALNNQAIPLGKLGRTEEALAAINEAVTMRRALAAARPDTYLPKLAMSLHNQAIQLGALGRSKDALAAINEAVIIYRELATASPDTHLPYLAGSLHIQSIQLGELGRTKDAVTAINEAVSVRRTLAAARPDTYLPDLAGSLNNQANRLGELGRTEDALTAINEAVTVYRDLAAARPDTHLPNLAAALYNKAFQLGALNRHQDALTAINEAVTVYKNRAAARPESHLPNLAAALHSQALGLGALNRHQDALTAINEAVTVYRDLAAARPDTHLPSLATALLTYGLALTNAGARDRALDADQEAVALLRRVAEQRPDTHELLDTALRNVVTDLRELGRPEEAAPIEVELQQLDQQNNQRDR
jgi:Trypsin-like peptidase domain/Tetratricopeptide repeat